MKKSNAKTKFLKFVKVKIRTFDSFNDDFSNPLFLVNETYLVRDSEFFKEPFVSYKNERRILDAIEPLDITEKIIHHSSMNGFKIARFIKTSKVYSIINDATILEYVRTLKKLHKVNIENLSVFDVTKVLETYKSKLDEKDLLKPSIENKILKVLATDTCEKVLSHNNLEKTKIKILENKVKLCDFRYGSLNSPLFDLAYFSNSHSLSEKEDLYLLNKFFGYKMRVKYIKLFKHYKKYIDILRYYRNSYYYTISGEINYLDLRNELKSKISI